MPIFILALAALGLVVRMRGWLLTFMRKGRADIVIAVLNARVEG